MMAEEERPLQAYQIDNDSSAAGKHIAATKFRVLFRFGFSDAVVDGMDRSAPVTPSLDREHVVSLSWSPTTSKIILAADGGEVRCEDGVRRFQNMRGKLEHSWVMRDGGHHLRILAYAAAPIKARKGYRQFDLFIDGKSFFDLPLSDGSAGYEARDWDEHEHEHEHEPSSSNQNSAAGVAKWVEERKFNAAEGVARLAKTSKSLTRKPIAAVKKRKGRRRMRKVEAIAAAEEEMGRLKGLVANLEIGIENAPKRTALMVENSMPVLEVEALSMRNENREEIQRLQGNVAELEKEATARGAEERRLNEKLSSAELAAALLERRVKMSEEEAQSLQTDKAMAQEEIRILEKRISEIEQSLVEARLDTKGVAAGEDGRSDGLLLAMANYGFEEGSDLGYASSTAEGSDADTTASRASGASVRGEGALAEGSYLFGGMCCLCSRGGDGIDAADGSNGWDKDDGAHPAPMRECECGDHRCGRRAHASCVTDVRPLPSVSHPCTPALPLPLILCRGIWATNTMGTGGVDVEAL